MAASAAQKALFNAIEKRAFDAAYHFTGDDDFRKHEALALLVNAAVDPATRDFYDRIARASQEHGYVSIYRLECAGKPVAIQFGVVDGRSPVNRLVREGLQRGA